MSGTLWRKHTRNMSVTNQHKTLLFALVSSFLFAFIRFPSARTHATTNVVIEGSIQVNSMSLSTYQVEMVYIEV